VQQLRLSSTPNESDLKRKIKSIHKFQHITKCTPSRCTKNDGRKGGKGDSEYWIIGKEGRSTERETRRGVWEREEKELGGEWREGKTLVLGSRNVSTKLGRHIPRRTGK
jgi:hypothetical protein